MQIDMHFYGVYALARSAGINPETALTIAYASQFVDDAVDDDKVTIRGDKAVLPALTSHKTLDIENAKVGDQWQVWVPFHFLPGNEGTTFQERMICRKDSLLANKMLANALDPMHSAYWPHMIGVTAHVYADTFSHFGFIGCTSAWNKVRAKSIGISEDHSNSIRDYLKDKFDKYKARFAGNVAEIVPVGHGAVETFPDRPYLKWNFEYETGAHKPEDCSRDNSEHFLDGCKALYEFFVAFVTAFPAAGRREDRVGWDSITGSIQTILAEEKPCEGRIKAWKAKIDSGAFFKTTEQDKTVDYDENRWSPLSLKGTGDPNKSDAVRFIKAAWKHRNFVLHEVMPKADMIAF